ncbi:hypothetical protein DFH07DRAFT_1007167 [Mycena maculata]|uniref:Chromo domain-containing protein n=1 Tax=Mycena maculata TaxID=230809 RepID=A0AAD7HKV3_9AGAR|nr:hypothetical protein DFH07DRAFT_1007167 [Mycena maculata]
MRAENDDLRRIARAAGVELEKNYAQMILMNKENARLRQQLHAKKNKPKRTYTTGHARLMTSAEMTQKLLEELQKKEMGELHKVLRQTIFPGIRAKHAQQLKEAQAAEKAAAKAAKEAEKAAVKAAKEVEKVAVKAAKEAAKAAKAAEREITKAARAAARGRGRGRGRGRARGATRGRGSRRVGDEDDIDDGEENSESEASSEGSPSPRRTPIPSPSPSTHSSRNNSPTGGGITDEDSDSGDDVVSINGHRWAGRRNLEFQVMWTDGDVTWEPLSNVNDCAAMDDYLVRHDVDDPLRLSKRKFLIDTTLEAQNE